jgi:hypothetical protein
MDETRNKALHRFPVSDLFDTTDCELAGCPSSQLTGLRMRPGSLQGPICQPAQHPGQSQATEGYPIPLHNSTLLVYQVVGSYPPWPAGDSHRIVLAGLSRLSICKLTQTIATHNGRRASGKAADIFAGDHHRVLLPQWDTGRTELALSAFAHSPRPGEGCRPANKAQQHHDLHRPLLVKKQTKLQGGM